MVTCWPPSVRRAGSSSPPCCRGGAPQRRRDLALALIIARLLETTLARRHLTDGALLLYDVTSTYLEGRRCELAQHGYSRDHRGDRPQLVIGLLCAADGCPVAVEVFDGNTADPLGREHGEHGEDPPLARSEHRGTPRFTQIERASKWGFSTATSGEISGAIDSWQRCAPPIRRCRIWWARRKAD